MTNSPQKRCTKCRETKSIELFSRDHHKPDGRLPRCKACIAEYQAENAEAIRKQRQAYLAANAETIREKRRAYRAANIELSRARVRAYQAANMEAVRKQQRIYRAENPDKIKAQQRASRAAHPETGRNYEQAYRIANFEKISARKKAHQRANPDLYRARSHARRARMKGNGGSFTRSEIRVLRQTQGGYCAYCGQLHDPDELTIDHIIPISRGGSNNISNICLACPTCNSSKNDKTPEEWVNRWYKRDK